MKLVKKLICNFAKNVCSNPYDIAKGMLFMAFIILNLNLMIGLLFIILGVISFIHTL